MDEVLKECGFGLVPGERGLDGEILAVGVSEVGPANVEGREDGGEEGQDPGDGGGDGEGGVDGVVWHCGGGERRVA